MNAATASAVTMVPVGLLGLQTMMSLVRSVIASAIASRSRQKPRMGIFVRAARMTWV
jgi:hypothetical protein